MYSVLLPLFLLGVASLGCGWLALRPASHLLEPRWPWFNLALSYVLGQGIIATLLSLLALGGIFSFPIVTSLLLVFSLFGVLAVLRSSPMFIPSLKRSFRMWNALPLLWKLVVIILVTIMLWGATTFGQTFSGDGVAYYLVQSKLVAFTESLTLVPKYAETFSYVGILAEMLYAALMKLGMPGSTCRILVWLEFFPLLILLWGGAQRLGIHIRGRLVACAVPLSSTALLLHWGSGKVDVFAVAPVLAACYFATIYHFSSPDARRTCMAYAGACAGLAAVYKLSYLVCVVPMLFVFLGWDVIASCLVDLRGRQWKSILKKICTHLPLAGWFIAGFTLAFLPYILKNMILLSAPFGNASRSGYEGWYSWATTARIVLTYPLALTYGDYWAQMGRLSVLVLAGAPLFFVYRMYRVHVRLLHLAWAVIIGMGVYIALFPSVFMPRYFLSMLLLLGIIAAQALANLSKKHIFCFVPLFVIFSLIIAQIDLKKTNQGFFRPFTSLEYLLNPYHEYLSASESPYFKAHELLNRIYRPGKKVLLISYYTFWLEPETILNSVSFPSIICDSEKDLYSKRWKYLKENKVDYIINDKFLKNKDFKNLVQYIPVNVCLKKYIDITNLYIDVYEIIWNCKNDTSKITIDTEFKFKNIRYMQLQPGVNHLNVSEYTCGGFSEDSVAGAWLHGNEGTLFLDLSAHALSSPAEIVLQVKGMVNDLHPEQRLELSGNEIPLGMLLIKNSTLEPVTVSIPSEVLKNNSGKIALHFKALNPVTPKSINAMDYDGSRISIFIQSVTLFPV